MLLVRVDLGIKTIDVPVADLRGQHPGRTVLVTAGMDGDEYAGIDAAYQLIERYQSQSFAGRLIVLPTVNVPGFEARCSLNPIDGLYPKNIFPGKYNGSASERLVYWLKETYLSKASFWYDAHGGATHERLHPFLWTFKTGRTKIDGHIERLHRHLRSDTVLYEHARYFSKARQLARAERMYVMAEAGELGVSTKESVECHLDWMEGVMEYLGMIKKRSSLTSSSPTILQQVKYTTAPRDGWWSVQDLPLIVHQDDLLGVWAKLDRSSPREFRASHDGHVLWWQETGNVQRGDIVCALAYV